MRPHGRSLYRWTLLTVLGQLSIRAVVGGGALLVAPSGRIVGLSTVPLNATPFENFLVPGLVLVVLFGLVPAVACYAIYAGRWWGWLASLAVASTLLVWILVEVAVGFDRPTIYVNLGTTGAILLLTSRSSIRREPPDTLV